VVSRLSPILKARGKPMIVLLGDSAGGAVKGTVWMAGPPAFCVEPE
jgi:hypothetical protein